MPGGSVRKSVGLAAAIAVAMVVTEAAWAQTPQGDAARDFVVEKCSQCHTDSMFRDKRQDARAWEATAYRMVGRGAVWTSDDIKTIAAFLGQNFGPDAPRATH